MTALYTTTCEGCVASRSYPSHTEPVFAFAVWTYRSWLGGPKRWVCECYSSREDLAQRRAFEYREIGVVEATRVEPVACEITLTKRQAARLAKQPNQEGAQP